MRRIQHWWKGVSPMCMLLTTLVCCTVLAAGCDSGSSSSPEEVCEGPQLMCGEQCVDPLTDGSYCGAKDDCLGDNAGELCTESETCKNGLCTPAVPECQEGEVVCGEQCVNPLTDTSYCGASGDCLGDNAGKQCAEGETCQQGLCAPADPGCKEGEVACGEQCINPLTDATYCGASGDCAGTNAGTVCAETQTCVNGLCTPPVCTESQVLCGGACIEPSTSMAYCGASDDCSGEHAGTACDIWQTCSNGICTNLPGVCGTDFTTGNDLANDCFQDCCAPFLDCYSDEACSACVKASTPGDECASDSLFSALSECNAVCLEYALSSICDSALTTGDPEKDKCINTDCCDEFSLCGSDVACFSCITDPMASGCDANAVYQAFSDCIAPCMGPGYTTVCGTEVSFGDPSIDICISDTCCPEFLACNNDASCMACVQDPVGTGCATNAPFAAFATCASPCFGGTPVGELCGTDFSYEDVDQDACVESNCCASFTACYADSVCKPCITDSTLPECSTNALYSTYRFCSDPCFGITPPESSICGSEYTYGESSVDTCITASCCTQFNACIALQACADCLLGVAPSGCESLAPYAAFMTCSLPCVP